MGTTFNKKFDCSFYNQKKEPNDHTTQMQAECGPLLWSALAYGLWSQRPKMLCLNSQWLFSIKLPNKNKVLVYRRIQTLKIKV